MRPLHACKVLITRAGNFSTWRISMSLYTGRGEKKESSEAGVISGERDEPTCSMTER